MNRKASLERLVNFFVFLPILLAVFSILVDGALPTLGKLAFERQFFIPSKALLIISVVPVLLIYLYRLTQSSNSGVAYSSITLLRAWLIGETILMLPFIYFVIIGDEDIAIRSVREYYFYYALIPFFLIGKSYIREFSFALSIMSAPLIIIGLTQFITSSPLIDVGNPSDKFRVLSYVFEDKIRAFSLFGSSVNYGYFINIILSICVAYIFFKKKNTLIAPICIAILVILFSVFTTYTRAIYMQSTFVLIALIIKYISTRIRSKFLTWLYNYFPIFALALVVLVTFGAIFFAGDDGIASGSTAQERYINWGVHIAKSIEEGWAAIIFGRGILQTDDDWYDLSILIDNSYVSIFSNFGLLGLIGWIYISWGIWQHLRIRSNENYLMCAFAAWYATWAGLSFVNNTHTIFPLIIMLTIGYSSAYKVRIRNDFTLKYDGRGSL